MLTQLQVFHQVVISKAEEKYTLVITLRIGPNVGIISANHNVYENSQSAPGEVKLGAYCWVGMGAVILPGVVLGDNTVVGAGSVVTKSFSSGYCVIAGNPATKVKDLEPDKCVRFKNDKEYVGYIKES